MNSGCINSIPIFGWVIDFCIKTSLAIPFWVVWTWGGTGQRFFYFLPDVYQAPSFLHILGLFISIGILLAFVPEFVSVSNNSESKTSEASSTS
jgi:hypothetical protein